MDIDVTLDRPATRKAPGSPRSAEGAAGIQDPRVEILRAELERQGDLMNGACMISDELRGLAILFHGVFCDTTLTENADFRLQRVSAAYLVESLLKRLADRLETAEDHARTSRIHAFEQVAR